MEEYHIDIKFKSAWKKKIHNWYLLNKRDLPWRMKENQNFYCIWISEVMLQQTQVSVVIPFYKKFLKRWPTLEFFFEAELEEILSIWQGMGYYKRALNLFKAKELLKKKKIHIESSSLKELPGVGDYISSAISAILVDEPCPVIDSNIKRIIVRVFGLNKDNKSLPRKIKSISAQLTPNSGNGDYCQSLMDLANKICKSNNPECDICPVSFLCESKGKSFSKKKLKIIDRKITVAFVIQSEEYFLIERTSKNLLQNLFCFPLSEFVEIEKNKNNKKYLNQNALDWMEKNKIKTQYKFLGEVSHKFSHFHLKVLIVKLRLLKKKKLKNFFWLTLNDLKRKPISRLMFKIIEKVE